MENKIELLEASAIWMVQTAYTVLHTVIEIADIVILGANSLLDRI
jgi:hypothetical protein